MLVGLVGPTTRRLRAHDALILTGTKAMEINVEALVNTDPTELTRTWAILLTEEVT